MCVAGAAEAYTIPSTYTPYPPPPLPIAPTPLRDRPPLQLAGLQAELLEVHLFFYLRMRRHLLVGQEPRVYAPFWLQLRELSSCFNKKRSMDQGGEYCTQGSSGRVRGASRPPDRAACRSLSIKGPRRPGTPELGSTLGPCNPAQLTPNPNVDGSTV